MLNNQMVEPTWYDIWASTKKRWWAEKKKHCNFESENDCKLSNLGVPNYETNPRCPSLLGGWSKVTNMVHIDLNHQQRLCVFGEAKQRTAGCCRFFLCWSMAGMMGLFDSGTTYLHTYIHTHIHTYTHTHIHTYTHTHIHTYIHTYIYTYTHTYIYIYTHWSNMFFAAGAGIFRINQNTVVFWSDCDLWILVIDSKNMPHKLTLTSEYMYSNDTVRSIWVYQYLERNLKVAKRIGRVTFSQCPHSVSPAASAARAFGAAMAWKNKSSWSFLAGGFRSWTSHENTRSTLVR